MNPLVVNLSLAGPGGQESCRQPRDSQNHGVKVTADDIAQLLASSPPRKVPAHVVKAAQGGGSGCFLPLFGLAFGSFGMIFAVIFFPWRLADDLRLASDRVSTVPGVITEVRKSNMSINDAAVMEYGFSYTPTEGDRQPRQGRCFTTGERWTKEAEVAVRYLSDTPEVACVDGARLTKGGGFGLFVIIFPLVGYGMVVFYVMSRRQTARLLREGLAAEVDILFVEETNVTMNRQRVYKIVLTTPGQAGGPPVTIKRVNRADLDLAGRHAADKQPVFVLYDPRKPTRLIFPEALLEP